MKGKNTNKAYEVITTKIVELLEQGTVPWKRPWVSGPAAKSYRGYDYRGINRMLLSTIASMNGLKGAWITFNQARKAGGRVKKGAKGVPVVFWKWIQKKDDDGEPTNERIPLCRYYTVFSICQTEGVKEPLWLSNLESPGDDSEPVKAAREFLEASSLNPGDPDQMAAGIFRAAEMMHLAGNMTDVRQLVGRLEQHFPGSQWTEEAKKLLEGGRR